MSAITTGEVKAIYGSVNTSAVDAFDFNAADGSGKLVNNLFQIQNTHPTNLLAYTFDGIDPVINGAGNTLPPYWTEECDTFVINGPGPLKIIGSGSGTTYTIKYA